MRAADPLTVLLPDAPPPYVEHARRVTTFLRLVRDDAKAARASAVAVSLERARSALDGHLRAQALELLFDLLRHHLYAELGDDSFAWCGEPGRSLQACWSELESLREDLSAAPHTPTPNESALAVARRLLVAAEQLGAEADVLALWSARLVRASSGAAAGEQAFEALAERCSAAVRPQVLCGWIECALDRGALRLARRVLARASSAELATGRLARLAIWCALLVEDEAEARALDARAGAWLERLPRPLIELRSALPQWLVMLSGRAQLTPATERVAPDRIAREAALPGVAPSHAAASHASLANATSVHVALSPAASSYVGQPSSRGVGLAAELARVRRDVGACGAALFRFRPRQAVALAAVDVAPGLRERQRDWLRAIEGLHNEFASLEHRAVVELAPAQAHRSAGAPLSDALSSASVQSAAVVACVDAHGEACGWLRLEWEHHLPASSARLRRIAQALAAHFSAESGREAPALADSEGAPRVEFELAPELPERPSAQVFQQLVDALGMKTAQRRWWGFDVGASRVRLAAQGGGVAGLGGAPGGRRAVLRALRTGALVRYDDPRPELSLARDSACGVVLAVRWRGELHGLLVVESTRRRDFPEALVQRWLERAAEFALALRIAQFRDWHRQRHGHEVLFGHGPGAWIEALAVAARSQAPVALVGSAGAGKTVAARWLHFAGARPDGALVERPAGGLGALAELRDAATVVLEHVELAARADQARLVELLDRSQASAAPTRWVVACSRRLADPSFDAQLLPGLRSRLQRLELRVPDLAQRRLEIPALAQLLAQRFAHEEGVRAPTFEDDALALLWRQPWPGNLRDLENFVFKLVLTAPGASLRAEDLERVARRFGLELARRLSSRTPDAASIRAALQATANLRGTVNKTRASLYLGWDPDTLVARMNDLAIDEHQVLRAERSIWEPEDTASATGPSSEPDAV
ncbi:MAG: hypothetical protein JNN27_12995 [Planctomycetes bacterium]|nr:hypothetical protein [Planctomycetota bacterium]